MKNEVISNSTSPYTTSNLTEDLTSTGMINDTVDKCNPDGTFCDGTVFESSYTSVRTEVRDDHMILSAPCHKLAQIEQHKLFVCTLFLSNFDINFYW